MCQVIKIPGGYAFSCGCDPDAAAERMALHQMEVDAAERERDASGRRYEPNRFEFRERSRVVQLGRRVNRIPATASRPRI